MKKAQGLSLNTVVIAAMVILVLIVITIIVIQNSGKFVKNTSSCESNGGICDMANLLKRENGDVYIENSYGSRLKVVPRPDLSCGETDKKCYLVLD